MGTDAIGSIVEPIVSILVARRNPGVFSSLNGVGGTRSIFPLLN